MNEQRGVIERPGRGIDHLAVNAARFANGIGLLAKLNEIVLARETLPTFGAEPERRINSAGGTARRSWGRGRVKWSGGRGAVRIGTIVRAWYPQVRGHWDLLDGICQAMSNVRVSERSARRRGAISRTVGGPARVINHVDARALVAGRIGFDHVPAEQREDLVEAGVAAQIRIVEIGVAAVAEAIVGRHQREAFFVTVPNTVAVLIEEG